MKTKTMAADEEPSVVIPELKKYLAPGALLECGEYAYCIEMALQEIPQKHGKPPKYKYETAACLLSIISALLNTSGGVIKVVPRDPRTPISGKYFEEWRNDFKDKLKFIPDDIFEQCISINVTSGQIYVLVHKSRQFITTDAHMHSRNTSGNAQVHHYDFIVKVVNQRTENVSTALPIPRFNKYMQQCPVIENKNLEFKCYQCCTVDEVIGRMHGDRSTKAIFGMANLVEGGYVILGVKEEPSKYHTFLGQELDDEKEFKYKLARLMTADKNGRKRVWGDLETVPVEGKHWTCEFLSLGGPPYVCSPPCRSCPHRKRRVLVVIHMLHCPGGMFESKPEAYSVNDDGFVEDLSFGEWRQKHQHGFSGKRKASTSTTPARKRRAAFLPTPPVPDAPSTSAGVLHTQEVKFIDNTTIAYSRHSSGWKAHRPHQPNVSLIEHPEVSGLFQTAYPVKYTPSRKAIEEVLSNATLLPTIDNRIGGPACGIAADTMWRCIQHTCTGAFGRIGTPPQISPHHVMDLLVVSESATVTLFIVNSQFEAENHGQTQNSYAFILGRILKRRILENMIQRNGYPLFRVECVTLNLDDSSPSMRSPKFYQDWFPSRVSACKDEFHSLCIALGGVLSNMQTCFSEIVKCDQNVQLSSIQNQVLVGLDANRFNIVEGPPGCGKTIIARRFCEQIGRENSAYISASKALTNRAASTGKIDAYYASDANEIVRLIQEDLSDKYHIVIDDNHRYIYSTEQLQNICGTIASYEDMYLHIFQDSNFQNYQMVTDPRTFRQFLLEHECVYGSPLTKTMKVIYRNAQVIGSFIKSQVCDLTSNVFQSELKCASPGTGDDVIIKQIKNLRTDDPDNGLLLHVKQTLSLSVDPKQRHYTPSDIAILVDNKNATVAAREKDLFKGLFRKFLREIPVHDADIYPVSGVIIDNLDNFLGLESKVVIYVLPKEERFDTTLSHVASTKHRIAVASRGMDRVVFVQEDNLDGQVVVKMKCDQYPASALQMHSRSTTATARNGDEPVQMIHVGAARCLDLMLTGELLYCSTVKVLTCSLSNGSFSTFHDSSPNLEPWGVAVSIQTGDVVVVYRSRAAQPRVSLYVYSCSSGEWSLPHELGEGDFPHVTWMPTGQVALCLYTAKKRHVVVYDIVRSEVTQRWVTDCRQISDISVDNEGNILCCDARNDRICVFTVDRPTADMWSFEAAGAGYRRPVSLCPADKNNFLVLHGKEVDGAEKGVITLWNEQREHIRDVVVGLPAADVYPVVGSAIRLHSDGVLYVLRDNIKTYDVADLCQ